MCGVVCGMFVAVCILLSLVTMRMVCVPVCVCLCVCARVCVCVCVCTRVDFARRTALVQMQRQHDDRTAALTQQHSADISRLSLAFVRLKALQFETLSRYMDARVSFRADRCKRAAVSQWLSSAQRKHAVDGFILQRRQLRHTRSLTACWTAWRDRFSAVQRVVAMGAVAEERVRKTKSRSFFLAWRKLVRSLLRTKFGFSEI